MQITPDSVTISDIKRYEKLMNGKFIFSQSNAQSVLTPSSERVHFAKHHWTVSSSDQFGPLEMKFEHPTSLIALNIEL